MYLKYYYSLAKNVASTTNLATHPLCYIIQIFFSTDRRSAFIFQIVFDLISLIQELIYKFSTLSPSRIRGGPEIVQFSSSIRSLEFTRLDQSERTTRLSFSLCLSSSLLRNGSVNPSEQLFNWIARRFE